MSDLITLLKIKDFLDFLGWVRSNFGGRSQESNLPGTAGGPNWI